MDYGSCQAGISNFLTEVSDTQARLSSLLSPAGCMYNLRRVVPIFAEIHFHRLKKKKNIAEHWCRKCPTSVTIMILRVTCMIEILVTLYDGSPEISFRIWSSWGLRGHLTGRVLFWSLTRPAEGCHCTWTTKPELSALKATWVTDMSY